MLDKIFCRGRGGGGEGGGGGAEPADNYPGLLLPLTVAECLRKSVVYNCYINNYILLYYNFFFHEHVTPLR